MSKSWFERVPSKLFTLLFVKRSIQELCLAKERMCGCFADRTISANGLNSSGNQQGHQPNMQMRRKVVESLCIWWVCEDHPALVWRGIHVSQNILRRIWHAGLLRSKPTRKKMDLPPWSWSQERFSVLNSLEIQKVFLSDLPNKTAAKSVNARGWKLLSLSLASVLLPSPSKQNWGAPV